MTTYNFSVTEGKAQRFFFPFLGTPAGGTWVVKTRESRRGTTYDNTYTSVAVADGGVAWSLLATDAVTAKFPRYYDLILTVSGVDRIVNTGYIEFIEVPHLVNGVITDHAALTGLTNDDHPQYLNTARADARFIRTVNNLTADASGNVTIVVGSGEGSGPSTPVDLTGYLRKPSLPSSGVTGAVVLNSAGDVSILNLATKADKAYVDTALAGKADASALNAKADVTALANKADAAALALKADASALTGFYTKTEVDTALATRATTSALTTKADSSAVNTALAGKVDTTTFNTALAAKADATALAGKADAATVAGLAPLANPTFTGTVSGISKAMIGLTNVDNTSDVSKPISAATQSALDNINNALNNKVNTSTLSNYATLAQIGESQITNNSAAGTVTLDASTGSTFYLRLTGPTVVTITNLTSSLALFVEQDSVGGRSLSLPRNLEWENGTVIPMPTFAGATQQYLISKIGTHTTVSVVGKSYSAADFIGQYLTTAGTDINYALPFSDVSGNLTDRGPGGRTFTAAGTLGYQAGSLSNQDPSDQSILFGTSSTFGYAYYDSASAYFGTDKDWTHSFFVKAPAGTTNDGPTVFIADMQGAGNTNPEFWIARESTAASGYNRLHVYWRLGTGAVLVDQATSNSTQGKVFDNNPHLIHIVYKASDGTPPTSTTAASGVKMYVYIDQNLDSTWTLGSTTNTVTPPAMAGASSTFAPDSQNIGAFRRNLAVPTAGFPNLQLGFMGHINRALTAQEIANLQAVL